MKSALILLSLTIGTAGAIWTVDKFNEATAVFNNAVTLAQR